MRATLLVFLIGCGARTGLATGAAADAGPRDATADQDAALACPAQLATTQSNPDTIAIADGFVYWHDVTGVWRVPLAGGPPQSIAHAPATFYPDLAAFAVGGGFVFFEDLSGEVQRFPVAGGPALSLGLSFEQPGFAASATFVHAWPRSGPDAGIVRRFDFAAQSFASYTLPEPPSAMSFVGEDAYAAADPGVYFVPFGGSEQILSGQTASALVVVGDVVYFTSNDATNGARIFALSKTTHAQSTIADTSGALAIATDGTDLYFTDTNANRVRRVEGKTGPVDDVAPANDELRPIDLALAGDCVYWTARSGEDGAPGAIESAPMR